MYYRVAIQTNTSPVWQWKSTMLGSLDVLFRFLKMHHTIPAHRLRIFTSSCREDINEMLVRENSGFANNSVTAEQFLRERHLHVWETESSDNMQQGTQAITEETTTVSSQLAMLASEMTGNVVLAPAYALNPLDRRRQEIEFGSGGDHDCSYIFTLPHYVPEMLAWMKLREKVQFNPIER